REGRLPGGTEPAHLGLARAGGIDAGHGERATVTLPGLAKPRLEAADGFALHRHRRDVREAMAAVAAPLVARMQREPVVEKAVAVEIQVQADHLRRARRL